MTHPHRDLLPLLHLTRLSPLRSLLLTPNQFPRFVVVRSSQTRSVLVESMLPKFLKYSTLLTLLLLLTITQQPFALLKSGAHIQLSYRLRLVQYSEFLEFHQTGLTQRC